MVCTTAVVLYFCVLGAGLLALFQNFADLLHENVGINFGISLIVSALITCFILFALVVSFVPFIQSFTGLL